MGAIEVLTLDVMIKPASTLRLKKALEKLGCIDVRVDNGGCALVGEFECVQAVRADVLQEFLIADGACP
ncbi:MAG TPA: hypothetical protein VM553_16045 [Dongiaceae bacterium]|nr:hypothetical protein [Dongiaceae bacterium]